MAPSTGKASFDRDRAAMDDPAWIDKALVSARPKALAALMRYFGSLDTAEEAFQEACLRALRSWPDKGPPRDPAAWLILVGRNCGVDRIRRASREAPLPAEDAISDLDDVEDAAVEAIDRQDFRDDILRLLFVCCHPELPATQQIALALRIVSGLTVEEIARAFLVSPAAMEQRITRAKRRIAASTITFDDTTAQDRRDRLASVSAMIYLVFNEGYSASGGKGLVRAPLCDEAIRLGRILAAQFPQDGELLGLCALMLFQHARSPARLDQNGEVVLLPDQDRSLWNRDMIREGLAVLERAASSGVTGPYQLQAAIAGVHATARTAADTDWARIDRLYRMLETLAPSPVVTLNRAVAVSKIEGADAALALIAPLHDKLDAYFNYHGTRGALLMELGRDAEAIEALSRAISLARTAPEAVHIRRQLDALTSHFSSGSHDKGR
jgi:RNA polymerase sigma-70 factor, ECF subfamily